MNLSLFLLLGCLMTSMERKLIGRGYMWTHALSRGDTTINWSLHWKSLKIQGVFSFEPAAVSRQYFFSDLSRRKYHQNTNIFFFKSWLWMQALKQWRSVSYWPFHNVQPTLLISASGSRLTTFKCTWCLQSPSFSRVLHCKFKVSFLWVIMSAITFP